MNSLDLVGDYGHGRAYATDPIGTPEPYCGNYVLENPTYLFERTGVAPDNRYIILTSNPYVS